MKHPKKPKLTDAERHARFKELAREVGAEDEAPGFDETVKRLAELPREGAEKPKRKALYVAAPITSPGRFSWCPKPWKAPPAATRAAC
jgi:hypothetical protein